MEPATAALAIQAGTAIAGGLSGRAEAKGEQKKAEINSYIGRTRAIQTGRAELDNLNSDLGTLRAAMGANQQSMNVGTLAFVDELRKTRDRERRINVGNRNAEAADYRMAGKNAEAKGKRALIGGALKAGPSMFDLYQLGTG